MGLGHILYAPVVVQPGPSDTGGAASFLGSTESRSTDATDTQTAKMRPAAHS